MNDPIRVASIMSEMNKHSKVPLSIKCRIGINEKNFEKLEKFVDTTSKSGGFVLNLF